MHQKDKNSDHYDFHFFVIFTKKSKTQKPEKVTFLPFFDVFCQKIRKTLKTPILAKTATFLAGFRWKTRKFHRGFIIPIFEIFRADT